MSENPFPQNIQDRKPVNINISFNINRKQITQNINTTEQQKTISVQNHVEEDTTPNLKPKNHFYRPPKTPQLAYLDKNNLTNQFEFIRPTQQLKRKKKVKRSSGDYTADKTSHFPFYQNEFQKSLPGHKRGYSATFVKKSTTQTVTKKKKASNKGSDDLYKQNKTVFLYEPAKQAKQSNASKSLKGIINKMINNELSKRSLPLPVVASKSKYNQSTSLTSRKMTTSKQTKKRSSKSQMMTKQKPLNMDKSLSDPILQQQYNRQSINKSYLLQKLGNFKSVENSLLICQAQRIEQQQQRMAYSQSKLISSFQKNKIVIRTDQSIECIDEIHDFERQKFRDQFFQNQTHEDYGEMQKNQVTQQIIQTYISLLQEQYQGLHYQREQQQLSRRQLIERRQSFEIDIMQNREQIIYDQNYLNSSDLSKVDDLLTSPISKKGNQNAIKNYAKNKNKPSFIQIEQIEDHFLEQSEKLIPSEKNIQQKQLVSQYLTKEQILAKRTQQNATKKQQRQSRPQKPLYQLLLDKKPSLTYNNLQKEQDHFRPFVSSQLGRQSLLNSSIAVTQQRVRLGELKKQQIQKWSYLLEYIKSNINKQASTQQVLEHVYDYLSQAKVDLIKEGKGNLQQSRKQLRFDDEITNKLSLQLQKSKDLVEKDQQSNGVKANIQPVKAFQSQRLKSEQEQILDQQIRSFKDEYQSEDNDEDIKFMNLETIQSALKNRIKILNQKKQKQLSKLQQLLQENKISSKSYQQQKISIQKWFKAQTNQISSVKKNIWKGYNQAKGILDKSYIGAHFEEQYQTASRNRGNNSPNEKQSLQKKNRKMMKCLSQSYLNRKKIDYKELIQKQQQKLEEQHEFKPLRRQKYVNGSDDQDSYNHEKELQEDSNLDQDSGDDIEGWEKEYKNQLSEQYVADYVNDQVQDKKINTSQEEIEKITKQVSQLRQQKLQTLNSVQKNKKSFQQRIDQQEDNNSKIQALKQPKPHHNEFSPTMIQYEQISKQLGSQSCSEGESQHSFNYYPSSQQSQQAHQYDYIQQKSQSSQNITSDREQSPISHKEKTPQHKKESIKQTLLAPSPISHIKSKFQTQLQEKLQLLTVDDREDIFEFLFLDLCIELYQQPCYDNKIMGLINKFITKQLEMSKRKKGVKTNLNVVKDYLKRFCGYILRTSKKTLVNMNVPMGPTAVEMLKYMHENDIDQQPIDDPDGVVTLIIPISTFDTFERSLLPTLQFDKYYDNQEKEHQRVNFLKNIMHIHNKALFDALNQYLDQERPFGIWGKPFPWKKSSSFPHDFTQIEHQQKLKKSAQKVVQACSYVCGLLVDKQQSLIGNAKVSQGYIQQIREDRISRMLANDMVESQERWVFYDDQETQVLVEIANSIYNKLLVQSIGDLALLTTKKQELY